MSIQFLHVCQVTGPECDCFPSTEFMLRDDVQQMLVDHKLQAVFDLWETERGRTVPVCNLCGNERTINTTKVRARKIVHELVPCPRCSRERD